MRGRAPALLLPFLVSLLVRCEIHILDQRILPNGKPDHYEHNTHYYNLVNHLSLVAREVSNQPEALNEWHKNGTPAGVVGVSALKCGNRPWSAEFAGLHFGREVGVCWPRFAVARAAIWEFCLR